MREKLFSLAVQL